MATWWRVLNSCVNLQSKYVLLTRKNRTVQSCVKYVNDNLAFRHLYGGLYVKQFCTKQSLSEGEVKRSVDDLSEKFSEAIGLLEDARHSLGTVYFSEDMKDAEEVVTVTLNDYRNLLDKLNEKQRTNVNRNIGLKMHELQAQLKIIKDMCRE